MLLIKCQKLAGALVSPKGITRVSNRLYRVRKAVFYSSPAATQIRLQVSRMSRVVQYQAFDSQSSVSRIRGRGYRFLIVLLFRPLQSTQSLSSPLAFPTNRIRALAGDQDALIYPLLRFLLIYFYNTLSSILERKQIGLKGGVNPSFRGILQSYSL